MATTYVDYTATAAQTDFAFTFPYLEDEHVVVEIDGSATTAFSIVTTPSTKIVLDSGATAGQVVRVRRKSQPDTNLVDFENGSVLTESELDRAYLHNRYLNEEIAELNDASLQKAPGTNDWDAGGSKIINVGTPTLTADATTKDYVDAKVNQASTGSSFPPTKWVFTGTAGANTTYSVTGAEVNGDTAYDVSVDGSVLEPTTDYTVDPDTDTLTIVNTLSGGEDIVVIERGFGVAISTGSIGEDQLQTNSVSTAKIQNDAVDNSKIADDAVDTDQLADHSVTAVKISNTDSKFNVQTTGEVGIGTASPSSKLDIVGDVSATQNIKTERSIEAGLDTTASATIVAVEARDARRVTAGSADPNQNWELYNNGINSFIGILDRTYNTYLSDNTLDPNPSYRLVITNTDPNDPTDETGGRVGIGTLTPSAPLEVSSTTGGVVFPRLTTTQRNLINGGSPTDGETIFNTTTNQVESWNGSSWGATGGGVSKYDSGWTQDDGTTTVDNSATLTFTHGLGTSAINAQLWVSGASDGSNPYMMTDVQESFQDVNMVGATITNITATQITVQFSNSGYVYMNSSGQNATSTTNGHNASATGFVPFTNKYIRLVVIG